MSRQILIDEVKVPAQSDVTWVFPVLDDDNKRREWLVDDFDLNLWFKDAVGRYPAHPKGDRDTRDDLKANWDKLKERLYRELEKQIEFGTMISVDGVRASADEWNRAQRVPKEELPPLTEAQREAAKRMRISEENYARDFLAGEWGRSKLIAKTERLARLLSDYLRRLAPGACVRRVALSTIQNSFDADIVDRSTVIPVQIREEVVDDLFEGGSSEAEQRIVKILEIAIKYQSRTTQ